MKHHVQLFALLSLLAGCATQQFRVPVMKPAPVDLVHYERIAVDRFEGEGSEQFSDQLAEALGAAVNPMTGRQGFTVLHRKDIDKALDELRDRRGAEWDQRTMEILDHWRTAQIVLKGSMLRHDIETKVKEEKARDQKGHDIVRHFRVMTAVVSVQLETTDVGGNRLFDRAMMTATAQAQRCLGDDPKGVLDPLPLLAGARAEVVQRYLDRVLPHQEYVAVNLYTDDALPDLQLGNGYAETGSWLQAAECYQRAVQASNGLPAEQRAKALFNFGVACEFSDRFDEARRSLQDAYALGREQLVLGELQRTNAREQEVQRLRQQSEPAPR